MYCKKCGKEIDEGKPFCSHCGAPVSETPAVANTPAASAAPDTPAKNACRCLPSFILGLIGGLFGMFGGICTTMCSMGSAGNSAFVFIFLGALVGLIGACLCFTKAKIGSVLEAVSAILMIVRAFSHSGATFSVVIGLLFMSAAAIVGIVYSFLIKRT